MKRTAKLQSMNEITELCEVFTGEAEGMAFSHSYFTFIDSDFNGFGGRYLGRKYDLTLDNVNNLLTHIPDEDIYPEPPPRFKLAPECLDGYHIKMPSFTSYEELKEHRVIPKILLAEVTALEMLSAGRHPNIAKYHGCIVKRGRLVGFALDRYTSTLEDRAVDPRPFDKKLCIQQVKSAIDYVHSHGLAHNDINPNNIMLDENDVAFLIDFGSCKPVDEFLLSAGTHGWMEEGSDYCLSRQSHDLFALSKLHEWIENPSRDSLYDQHPEWIPASRRHLRGC